MSWSVSYMGTPTEVKTNLASQFNMAKLNTIHIPHENEGVVLFEAAVNNQLDFLIKHRPDMNVQASASGAAGIAPEGASWKSYTQTSMLVNEVIL